MCIFKKVQNNWYIEKTLFNNIRITIKNKELYILSETYNTCLWYCQRGKNLLSKNMFIFFLPQHELILNCYTKGIHTKTICHIENVRDNAQTKCARILTREKYIHGIMLHCKLVLCETLRKWKVGKGCTLFITWFLQLLYQYAAIISF